MVKHKRKYYVRVFHHNTLMEKLYSIGHLQHEILIFIGPYASNGDGVRCCMESGCGYQLTYFASKREMIDLHFYNS